MDTTKVTHQFGEWSLSRGDALICTLLSGVWTPELPSGRLLNKIVPRRKVDPDFAAEVVLATAAGRLFDH